MHAILKRALPLLLATILVLTAATGLAVVAASAEESEITYI